MLSRTLASKSTRRRKCTGRPWRNETSEARIVSSPRSSGRCSQEQQDRISLRSLEERGIVQLSCRFSLFRLEALLHDPYRRSKIQDSQEQSNCLLHSR